MNAFLYIHVRACTGWRELLLRALRVGRDEGMSAGVVWLA